MSRMKVERPNHSEKRVSGLAFSVSGAQFFKRRLLLHPFHFIEFLDCVCTRCFFLRNEINHCRHCFLENTRRCVKMELWVGRIKHEPLQKEDISSKLLRAFLRQLQMNKSRRSYYDSDWQQLSSRFIQCRKAEEWARRNVCTFISFLLVGLDNVLAKR